MTVFDNITLSFFVVLVCFCFFLVLPYARLRVMECSWAAVHLGEVPYSTACALKLTNAVQDILVFLLDIQKSHF